MQICGEAKLGDIRVYFIRKDTGKGITWYLFRQELNMDGSKFRLNLNSLQKFKFKDLAPFIVSAQKVSLSEYQVYGNPNLIQRIMQAYNNANSFNYSDTEEKKVVESDVVVQIVSQSDKNTGYYLNRKFRYRDLELSPKDNQSNNLDLNKTEIFTTLKEKIKKDINAKAIENDKPEKEDIKFESQTISFNFLYKDVELKSFNYTLFSTREPELEWQSIDLNFNKTKGTMESILASNAKSLAQLRVNFDLSWYFDERGNCKKDYEIVNTLDRLEYYCKKVFPKIKLWAVDIESTGLNMFVGSNRDLFDHTVSIMVSWKKDQALFFPIDMINIPNLPEGWVDLLKPWLEKIKCVGHNIIFDAKGLFSDFGIKLKIAHDTMQLNFNINCHRAKWKGNGLKALEHRYFGVDTLELKDIFGTSKYAGLYRHLSPTLALLYACPDVDYCLQLLYVLWEELPATARKAYKLDMMVFEDIWEMDCVGNKINLEKAIKYRKANNEDKDLLQELMYRLAGQTIKKREKLEEITMDLASGKITEEQLDGILTEYFESNEYKNAREVFDINSTKQLGEVMFDKMGYPVIAISEKSKLPKIDSTVLKKLMDFKTDDNTGWLKQDVASAFRKIHNNNEVLIKKNEINQMKYPLALLIVEYRLREKRDGTFYHQIIDGSVDNRYYTATRPANAETFRLINVVQTLQGYMKQLVVPYDEDYYMLVFDFSQIEYRYMAGMANVKMLVDSLNSPRADFHKECCALLHNIKPWQVTGKMRKEGKSLNFAIPYGMGDYSICQQLFKKVTEELLILARRQLNTWQEKFHLIWDFLETRRDFALENGYVENELGRRRYFFDGSDPDSEIEKVNLNEWKNSNSSAREKAIRRASGNFPIQSGAADLFKLALHNFRRRLKEEGLGDLVKTSATVHDEIVSSVHKSVNPYFLYKIIYEECMLSLDGHPRYFAGVSIVDNWYEGKADEFEAPIEFVQNQITSGAADEKFVYQEDAKNHVFNDIKKFMTSLFYKEYEKLGVDFSSDTFDLASLLDKATDYFILDKVSVYYPLPSDKSRGSVNKKYDNDAFIRGFEEFVLANLNHESYNFIYPDDYPEGKTAIVSKAGRIFNNGQAEEIVVKEVVQPVVSSKNTSSSSDDLDSVMLLFSEMDNQNELDLNLDLDLDNLDDSDDNDVVDLDIYKDQRLNSLAIYEMEEGLSDDGLFDNFNIFIDTSEMKKEEQDIWKEYEEHPEEFNTVYSTTDSLVRVSSTELYINIGKVDYKNYSKVVDYLNNFAVAKGTLGSLRLVLKEGREYNYTDVYLKNYDLNELNKFMESMCLVTV